MNALCGPSVAEADMLFATLDPTSRKLILPSGMAVLLVDTVGFVSRLPHNLVEAFKSTLEEAAWSDVIIRVADAGDEQREEQLAVTDEVLDGLDCADIPRLTVYNSGGRCRASFDSGHPAHQCQDRLRSGHPAGKAGRGAQRPGAHLKGAAALR